MLPNDLRRYLFEIWRVLKPGGTFLSTFFLLESASPKETFRREQFNFNYQREGFRTASIESPEGAVGYEMEYIHDLYHQSRFENALMMNEFQDTLVARKPWKS